VISRIAPTPSGFLHRGNAANALLVAWLAWSEAGQVALRVDDLDSSRTRPEYVDDIFAVLSWLGIDWQTGPQDRSELQGQWSARLRLSRYRSVLDAAIGAGLPVYACACSRSVQHGPASGGCAGGCARQGIPWEPGRSALRLQVPLGTTITVGDRSVDVAADLGDFVIWRRDDLPAYHLASVVDDLDLGVTDIVRGVDLLPSTAAQIHLARSIGAGAVAHARYWHHGLVAGTDGGKLSKSQLRSGGPLPRTGVERDAVQRLAVDLGSPLGIAPPQ
jgi:glutamyl-tRNA synthetase